MPNYNVRVINPPTEFCHFVRRIIITEGSNLKNEVIPIVPTGFSYITYCKYPFKVAYSYGELQTSKDFLAIAGQLYDETPKFILNGDCLLIGLEILPSYAHYIFGIDSGNYVDRQGDQDILSHKRSIILKNILSEKVNNLSPDHIALKMLEAIKNLEWASQPKQQVEKALELIISSGGNLDVSDIYVDINVSQRHFRRIFNSVVGLSPKKYAKIIQFNSVFEAIQQSNNERLSELALKNGYYDHSHFIHDFKKFLMVSPQKFIKSEHYFLRTYLGGKR